MQNSPPLATPELIRRMELSGVYEDDLEEEFVLGSGPGGQKINKTHSCVRLRHVPSGREVRCQATRSREKNRVIARELLCAAFEEEAERRRLVQARKRALRRARMRKPGPAAKKRRREEKSRHSSKKQWRRSPGADG